MRELAEVIHAGEEGNFGNYTFESWLEASQLRVHQKQAHEDWIRSVNFEIQVPRVIRLLRYRSPAQARRSTSIGGTCWPVMGTNVNIAAGTCPSIS